MTHFFGNNRNVAKNEDDFSVESVSFRPIYIYKNNQKVIDTGAIGSVTFRY